MDIQELDNQIEEGKSVVASAARLLAEQKAINEKAGVSDDIFAEVLASDNFSREFKDKIREERAKAISDIEAQSQKYIKSRNSKITSRQSVTKI